MAILGLVQEQFKFVSVPFCETNPQSSQGCGVLFWPRGVICQNTDSARAADSTPKPVVEPDARVGAGRETVSMLAQVIAARPEECEARRSKVLSANQTWML